MPAAAGGPGASGGGKYVPPNQRGGERAGRGEMLGGSRMGRDGMLVTTPSLWYSLFKCMYVCVCVCFVYVCLCVCFVYVCMCVWL